MTHFELLGLQPTVDLDLDQLERAYREQCLSAHPDRLPQAGARERRQALELTTLLNQAYQTLKDPVKRAFYLLKLIGIDVEQANSQRGVSPDFLEEMMTLREQLTEAISSKNSPRIQVMAASVEAMKSSSLQRSNAALRALQVDSTDREAIETVSLELGRVRYFTRFLEEVDRMEEEAWE